MNPNEYRSINSTEINMQELPANNSLKFKIPLLPQPISVKLEGIFEKFRQQSNIRSNPKNKVAIFEVMNVATQEFLTLDDETQILRTNLPLLLFHFKTGSSDRIYLYYTLADLAYLSFTQRDFESYTSMYLDSFTGDKSESLIELNGASGQYLNYNYQKFILDPDNKDYIASMTLLPEFQMRLREVTGVKELGYVQPSLLRFQIYIQHQFLEQLYRGISLDFNHQKQGDRVDYQANTHTGYKPLFLSETLGHSTDELKEVYWLNSNNYRSSGERLIAEEDPASILKFSESGFWKPSLEELMKIGFADYLTFKTYRPNDILPSIIDNYILGYFSNLYLIDFIGRGAKPQKLENTTAFALLNFFGYKEHFYRTKRQIANGVDVVDEYKPEEIALDLLPSELTYLRKYEVDKVPLMTIPDKYKFYKIRPVEFVPFLEDAYWQLTEEEKTNNRDMYNLISSRALEQYIKQFQQDNLYISTPQITEMINSLCVIHQVNPSRLKMIYEVPERMYTQDFNLLMSCIQKLSNTKTEIF